MSQNATHNLDTEAQAWLDRLDPIGEERGYFEPIGKQHSAILTDEGPDLIVTFESISGIRTHDPEAQPLGFEMVAKNGYSNLCILAHGDTWFRDASLYGYFDRLVDDGFFEDFDNVVFYGANMGGYGAVAYSVAAPGATVIAVQPQATLDPAVTGWDTRFKGQRRKCFTDRYGFGPDMIEGADRAFIIFDPEEEFDAMHASLFTRANTTMVKCPNLGPRIEDSLRTMEILQDLIETALTGDMMAADFFELYRARRDNGQYLRNLLTRLEDDGRVVLIEALCKNVIERTGGGPRFRRRLKEIQTHKSSQDAPKADNETV
ncbi:MULTISPECIES: phosphoadenosine phosphosulfate reductase [Falsihalocynthiibacter]|uniref:phosphoadenosine phosphosulfate reductase n=1 Tax=Falsihalocynthiibacter TaxID=2854182 RepID=UPI003002FE10